MGTKKGGKEAPLASRLKVQGHFDRETPQAKRALAQVGVLMARTGLNSDAAKNAVEAKLKAVLIERGSEKFMTNTDEWLRIETAVCYLTAQSLADNGTNFNAM